MNEHRLYTSSDMVRLQCDACSGCGECCRGMGDTIHLDPYDVWQLCAHLHKSFQELNGHEIGLHAEDGIILPHLASNESDACVFLSESGTCSIHAFRPGYCRLFPLGREYDDTGMHYFVTEPGCPMPGKAKVKIGRWLDIPDLPVYEQYVTSWHGFVKDVKYAVSEHQDEEYAAKISLFLLQVFFAAPYDPSQDFFSVFALRLKHARSAL